MTFQATPLTMLHRIHRHVEKTAYKESLARGRKRRMKFNTEEQFKSYCEYMNKKKEVMPDPKGRRILNSLRKAATKSGKAKVTLPKLKFMEARDDDQA